jgi:putative inorganic carbon (hco3(-)) transporter
MALLLLYVFSLPLMQPPVQLLGLQAAPSDLVFIALAAAWGLALLRGEARLVRDPAWWPLLFYFAAMAISLIGAEAAAKGAFKLLTQLYLLGLPVIVLSLVRGEAELKQVLRWWIGATAMLIAMAIITLALFYLDRGNPLLDRALFHFGTLPPGDYPRLRLSFVNGNMLCNYLIVSLMIVVAWTKQGWGSRAAGWLLCGGILLTALFTFSPGLGAIALVSGLALWLVLPSEHRLLRAIALASAIAAALLFILATAVTPILHGTAPYLIRLPPLDLALAPSARLMVWTEAVRNFLAEPLLGRGLGAEAVLVRYQDPSGNLQRLTDAHNSYLSIAVQCGVAGLLGLLLVTLAAARIARPFRFEGALSVTAALGVAFIGAFAYHGLSGSFEDARHLWLLYGLLVASRRLEPQPRAT